MSFGTTVGRNPDEKDLRQSWQTPPALFDELHAAFNFTIDACASSENALLPRYWSKEDDCVKHSWKGERVFCNPPFSGIANIIAKGREADVAVFLFPVTAIATKYYRENEADFIVVPSYRQHFVPPPGLKLKNTPSPSLATVFLVYGGLEEVYKLENEKWMIYLSLTKHWRKHRNTTRC